MAAPVSNQQWKCDALPPASAADLAQTTAAPCSSNSLPECAPYLPPSSCLSPQPRCSSWSPCEKVFPVPLLQTLESSDVCWITAVLPLFIWCRPAGSAAVQAEKIVPASWKKTQCYFFHLLMWTFYQRRTQNCQKIAAFKLWLLILLLSSFFFTGSNCAVTLWNTSTLRNIHIFDCLSLDTGEDGFHSESWRKNVTFYFVFDYNFCTDFTLDHFSVIRWSDIHHLIKPLVRNQMSLFPSFIVEYNLELHFSHGLNVYYITSVTRELLIKTITKHTVRWCNEAAWDHGNYCLHHIISSFN